jgi:hypothetical protein
MANWYEQLANWDNWRGRLAEHLVNAPLSTSQIRPSLEHGITLLQQR